MTKVISTIACRIFERRLCSRGCVNMKCRDVLKELGDEYKAIEIEREHRRDDVGPAPAAGEVPAVACDRRDEKYDQRENADDDSGRDSVKRKEEAGRAGQDRCEQEECGHRRQQLVHDHAGGSHQAGHNGDQADDDVDLSEKGEAHAKDHLHFLSTCGIRRADRATSFHSPDSGRGPGRQHDVLFERKLVHFLYQSGQLVLTGNA